MSETKSSSSLQDVPVEFTNERPKSSSSIVTPRARGGSKKKRKSVRVQTPPPPIDLETVPVGSSETWSPSGSDSPLSVPAAHQSRISSEQPPVRYSLKELIQTLGNEKDSSELSPEMQRRVLDFRLAQQKRREKYGQQHKCGIFGMYAHLADLRIDLEWSEDSAWRRQHDFPYYSWADFDEKRQKGSNRPWFTYFVILLCTIMLIVEFGLNGWKIAPLSVNPLIGPSAQALIEAGARDTPLIVNENQWFRIFSPLFLHAGAAATSRCCLMAFAVSLPSPHCLLSTGIIHYVINMAALWFVGAAVEQCHGIVNAMVLFFIPGIGGNILSAIFLPQYISVGASGGIFGLIGGCIADIILSWHMLFIKTGDGDVQNKTRNLMVIVWLVADVLVNIIIGFTPFVDNFTHLGGLVYGILCGFSTIEPLPVGFFGVHATPWGKVRKVTRRYGGLILSVILIIATIAILATMNVNEPPCNWCRYISCIPFPFHVQDKWWYCDDCDSVTATLYKNNYSDSVYDMIDLVCPDGQIEEIQVGDKNYSDREVIRSQLPTYCREYCPDKFN